MESIKFKPKRIMASKLGNLAQWGDMTPEKRFWNNLSKKSNDECWEWKRRRTPKNYGAAHWGNASVLAHRLAWTLTFGPIPEGLCVLHRCDNPPCCNPSHLFLGDRNDNTQDMISKGRARYITSEQSRLCKLSVDKVLDIRKRLDQGQPDATLAAEYGVAKCTIQKIRRNEIWKNVHAT